MCLILFAHKAHPNYPLVLAANRDEAHARPTAPAAFWNDEPDIYGGRDLERGGTWLGISRNGEIAAVTNYRSADGAKNSTRSRGELVAGYLRGRQRPADYLARLRRDAGAYNGFNLIAGSVDELCSLSNRGGPPVSVAPGVHGLSNHLLNTPWPKVERGKKLLTEVLAGGPQNWLNELFRLLAERAIAPDESLPETGVGLMRERVLSPAFIVSPAYGTRSSTVVLVDNHGQVEFVERSFDQHGNYVASTTGTFTFGSSATPAGV